MRKSWLPISPESPFSLANIPFGIISTAASQTLRPAVAIGDYALDLSAFAAGGGFSALAAVQAHHLPIFSQRTLNDFAAAGRKLHAYVRNYLQEVLSEPSRHQQVLKENAALRGSCLVPLSDVRNHLPLQIGDYTDFYAGLNHAVNVGVLFRGADNALQPNYVHLPVGYHSRASSVVVSGTQIRRPSGQVLPASGAKQPVFRPCESLDMELELAAFVCQSNKMGAPIAIDRAESHIFGYVLMNDWSARDIQAWEYVPLGPFDSKNFATTISPWVVLGDALEPFRTPGLRTKAMLPGGAEMPALLPYLRESRPDSVYDIDLSVALKPGGAEPATVIARTNARNLLYSFPQMIAHHTVSGCPMNVGDLLGSGTISGRGPGRLGSLLEQTKGGKEPIQLATRETRRFLEDFDEVVMTGFAGKMGEYVGFGECNGVVLPALQ